MSLDLQLSVNPLLSLGDSINGRMVPPLLCETGCLGRYLQADRLAYVQSGSQDDTQSNGALRRYLEMAEEPKVVNGCALLSIHGPIEYRPSVMGWMFGGCASQAICNTYTKVMDDSSIDRVLMRIDSPGGIYTGTPECGNAMLSFRGKKPVTAVVDPMAASGALWLGRTCERMVVVPSGQAGSIGAISKVESHADALKRAGVDVRLIRSPEWKGEGSEFEPISEEFVAYATELVTQIADEFVRWIAKCCGVSPSVVKTSFGKGRMLTAKQACDVGLCNGISSLEKELGSGVKRTTTSLPGRRPMAMSTIRAQQHGVMLYHPNPSRVKDGTFAADATAAKEATNEANRKTHEMAGSTDREGHADTAAAHGKAEGANRKAAASNPDDKEFPKQAEYHASQKREHEKQANPNVAADVVPVSVSATVEIRKCPECGHHMGNDDEECEECGYEIKLPDTEDVEVVADDDRDDDDVEVSGAGPVVNLQVETIPASALPSQTAGGIAELVSRTFATRNMLHLSHLSTNSLSQHLALGDLYDAIISAVDKIVEIYQGKFGVVSGMSTPEAAAPADVTAHVKAEAGWVEANRSAISRGDTAIENAVDELIGEYHRAVYKLENLK